MVYKTALNNFFICFSQNVNILLFYYFKLNIYICLCAQTEEHALATLRSWVQFPAKSH